MDLKIICGLMLLLLAISTGSAFAQQAIISVQTDDNHYDEEDTIVISGTVGIVVGERPVTLQIFYKTNLVDIAQITVAQDGSYSHAAIAGGPKWQKLGNYTVIASYGDGHSVETEFSYAPKSSPISTTTNFEVEAGNHGTFDIEYTITGGATVKDIVVDSEKFALVVQIDATDEGVIILNLPREFIGAENQDSKDIKFIILIDGAAIDYEESVVLEDFRGITIKFEQGDSNIEIIGTYVVPEFGAIAMMILIVGIIMVTVLATRNKFQIQV